MDKRRIEIQALFDESTNCKVQATKAQEALEKHLESAPRDVGRGRELMVQVVTARRDYAQAIEQALERAQEYLDTLPTSKFPRLTKKGRRQEKEWNEVGLTVIELSERRLENGEFIAIAALSMALSGLVLDEHQVQRALCITPDEWKTKPSWCNGSLLHALGAMMGDKSVIHELKYAIQCDAARTSMRMKAFLDEVGPFDTALLKGEPMLG